MTIDLSRKRVLVTGGAGFLGSHLTERLIKMGASVVSLDNYCTGSGRNLAALDGNPALSILDHDVVDPFDVEVDAIFNLACPASPKQYQADPVHTTRTCVVGALNVLELARRRGIPVMQASTSEIYGDPEVHPQSEDYRGSVSPIGPRACYDEGKRCAETLFFDFHRKHGVPIKVARIFNTYGPRTQFDDGRVVSNFLVQALRGDPITIYGDGSQTRSFCFVSDLIEGFIALMQTPKEFTGPVNLGNPNEMPVRTLAEEVLRITGSKSPLVYRPMPQDDPRRRRPDIRLAQTALGWSPRVDLKEGLERTVVDFRERLAYA